MLKVWINVTDSLAVLQMQDAASNEKPELWSKGISSLWIVIANVGQ